MNINDLCQPASSTKQGPSTTEIDCLSDLEARSPGARHQQSAFLPRAGRETVPGLSPWLLAGRLAFTWCPPCTHVSLQISPSHKNTTPMTSFNSITSVNRLSPNKVTV